MADDLEARLLRRVLDANLPPEEPIMRWVDWPDDDSLKLRGHDHALLLEGGQVEYYIEPGGAVQVKDYRDPRAMRFQRYEPARPGRPPRPQQPYMPPHVEDCDLPAG